MEPLKILSRARERGRERETIYASPLSGLKTIFHLTHGFAALTLGFYVSALWAFCRFAAVDGVDGVPLSTCFLLFGKDFLQISTFVSPRRGSGLREDYAPGSASLHLGLLMVPPRRG